MQTDSKGFKGSFLTKEIDNFSSVDKIIFFAIAIHVFIGRYFFPSDYSLWHIAVLLLSIYVMYENFFHRKVLFKNESLTWLNILFIFSIFYLLFVIFDNLINKGFGILAVQNLLLLLSPFLMSVYLVYIFKKYNTKLLWKFLKSVVIFSNIYFWINVPLIILEKLTSSFMIAKFIAWNSYIPDSITGLIGYSGTNIINLFWVSLLISNAISFVETKEKRYLFTVISEFCVMLYFSIFFNENKSFIPTTLLFFGIFFLTMLNKKGLLSLFLYIGSIFCLLFVVVLVIYYLIPDVWPYVEKLSKLLGQIFDDDSSNDKTNERAYLIQLAFKNYQAAKNGVGLNRLNINTQSIYIHLAINSLTLLLFMGGLKLYIAVTTFYGLYLKNLFSFESHAVHKFFIFLSLLFALLVVTISAQPFRDFYIYYFYLWFVFNITLFVRINEENFKSA